MLKTDKARRLTRGALLRMASERTHQLIGEHILKYAQRIGAVDRVEKIGGWQSFTEVHLEQLVDYIQTRSRLTVAK